jgi:protein TonB
VRFGSGFVASVCVSAALLVGFCEVDAAFAQETDATQPTPSPPPAPKIENPHWVRIPDADDLYRVYPRSAAHLNLGGRVVISCVVTTTGTLDSCSVVNETPPGNGFGTAGLELSKHFRMSTTTSDGRPTAGASVVIPIKFTPPN